MITKAVSGNMIEEMPLYQRTKQRLLDAQNQIVEKDKALAEKDNEIALLKEEIKSLKKMRSFISP